MILAPGPGGSGGEGGAGRAGLGSGVGDGEEVGVTGWGATGGGAFGARVLGGAAGGGTLGARRRPAPPRDAGPLLRLRRCALPGRRRCEPWRHPPGAASGAAPPRWHRGRGVHGLSVSPGGRFPREARLPGSQDLGVVRSRQRTHSECDGTTASRVAARRVLRCPSTRGESKRRAPVSLHPLVAISTPVGSRCFRGLTLLASRS